MRTTLELPDPLFREVKTRAVQQGIKLKDLIARYIEAGLRDQALHGNGGPSRKRSTLPIIIAAVPGAALAPALTNAELQSILNEEDAERFRNSSRD